MSEFYENFHVIDNTHAEGGTLLYRRLGLNQA
jgi:hypothetical protein